MQLNKPKSYSHVRTHEGAQAFPHLSLEQQLRRSVLSCLLWEDQFYESGVDIASRIRDLALAVPPRVTSELAIEAREVHHLRHVPLLLLEALTVTGRGNSLVKDTIARVIQRPDEMGEFLSLYFGNADRKKAKQSLVNNSERVKLSNQVRKGLARAFNNFDEYQLAKYDREKGWKLKDIVFLSRPKGHMRERNVLADKVVAGALSTPDTWEVNLSAGADKRETFTRLLQEEKLGYLALLRNLRNMAQSGVNPDLVKGAILARKGAQRVLPFRFIAAARHAPQFERELDQALCENIWAMPPLSGKTIVLVDVSGSMEGALSSKSDLKRIDAAAALASVINGDLRVFSFSDGGAGWSWHRMDRKQQMQHKVIVEVPPRRGLAGVDAVINSQHHGGTLLGRAVTEANELPHDRLIVVTDEQSHDPVPDPVAKFAYMINVASYKNGVGYGKWTHLDGFSENIIRFINAMENSNLLS